MNLRSHYLASRRIGADLVGSAIAICVNSDKPGRHVSYETVEIEKAHVTPNLVLWIGSRISI
jgi:hypothetical protein